MIAELAGDTATLLFFIMAIAYFVLIRVVGRLEYRLKLSKEPYTDQFCLERLAVMRGVGEYEIFKEAGYHWHVPETKKEEDFKFYLKNGKIPHYVRDFVRQYKKEIEKSCSPKFPFDSLPPSWPK